MKKTKVCFTGFNNLNDRLSSFFRTMIDLLESDNENYDHQSRKDVCTRTYTISYRLYYSDLHYFSKEFFSAFRSASSGMDGRRIRINIKVADTNLSGR